MNSILNEIVKPFRLLTVDSVMSLGPCANYSRERVINLFGERKEVSLKEALLTQEIPYDDRTWLARKALPSAENHRIWRLWGIACAESVLHIFEKNNPKDDRPRKCIEAAKAFIDGKISEDELEIARSAASAAYASAADAAANDALCGLQQQKNIRLLVDLL